MNINTKTSLVGFLLALSALSSPSTAKTMDEVGRGISRIAPTAKPSIEQRLNRLNAAIRAREEQLPESFQNKNSFTVAQGWADGRDREWVNGRRGGWGDGRNGGWGNVNPWRNGWSDGGSFYNYNPWRNTWGNGGWVNRSGGGGFVNVR